MPDLRTVLSDAIEGYFRSLENDGYRPEGCSADDLADVILGLPGVAVTQLPEPQADWHGGKTLWKAGPHQDDEVTIRKSDGRISFGVSTPFDTPEAARMAAAALLAAVVLSEGETRVDPSTGRFLCCGTDSLATDAFHAAGCPKGGTR